MLEVYTEVESIGRTSMKVHVEAWARRFQTSAHEKVTDATFTFVAIGEDGRPRPISRNSASVLLQIGIQPEQVGPDILQVRFAALELLRDGVDIAPAPLERT